MKTNIAAVAVLYNPDKSFISNIHSYAAYVSLLVLVDNSEIPDHTFYASLEKDASIKLIIYKENKGIATALNDAVKLVSKSGFEWILTMDQDSWFEKPMIEKYFSLFEQLPGKNKIAAIGPVFENKTPRDNSEEMKKVTSLITSGCLINIAIFNEIGGFDEKLFIDEVDHEYCYRAGTKGFSILQLQQVLMQHSLGRSVNVTTIGGRQNRSKSLHAPVRLYYIVRNSCYVIATYKKKFPGEMKIKWRDVLVRIKNNFLYGDKKLAVLKYVIRGFIDYKRKRFGKY